MKAFITKYALTEGILEKEGEINPQARSMFCAENETFGYFHGEGKDWHRTREGALKRAESMRLAKIASLKKQISKLEALKLQ